MGLAVKYSASGTARVHEPAMAPEVRELLCLRPGKKVETIIDATLATGGHAAAMLEACDARLLGLDRDTAALAAAASRLEPFGSRVVLRQANFAEIAQVAADAGFASADAIFADLGMSTFALDNPERGFSFNNEGPLDMRMDPRDPVRAYDIVNEESEAELARIIYTYGEERASRRIARTIVQERRKRPIATTAELRATIERALGPRRRGGVHPATRTFQALRIAVNHEIESLAALLEKGPALLSEGGRIAIIAYHSLEDRPVKARFRELVRGGGFTAITAKALRPSAAEVSRNPRARSARLRCVERSES